MVSFDPSNCFFAVDDYNVDEPLESSYDLLPGIRKAMQVSLTVVVDRAFALGGVDLRACFFIDHCCVNFTFTCYFSRLISTTKMF